MADCRNNNTLFVLALFFGIGLLAWFFADLLDSKAGERAAAFGGVIGGIIGASGAIFAVYLTLTRQRNEDTAKVRAAVRTELTTYSKYVIGTLEVCRQIANGLRIPMSDAEYIGKNLHPPVIYPAVADRVGLLRRPQATIEFYMRIAEAKSNLAAMRAKVAGLAQAQSQMQNVQPASAVVVADSLITALQVVRPILADDDPTRAEMDVMVQRVMLKEIDAALASAQLTWPNAESFKAAL
jgi:hypothetical protein